MKRPGGNGTSRTKVAALALAIWSIGARAAGVPETIVDGATGAIVAAVGWFLRDAR